MNYTDNDIAIIGISIRFPQANTLDDFWEGIKGGKDYICNLSENRLKDLNSFYDSEFGSIQEQVPKAAFLNHIDLFDYEFFHINKREACYMDPAQRIFLETAYNCFEDAGYMGDSLKESNTGIFVGYGGDFEFRKMINYIDKNNETAHSTGILTSFITSRLSYMFDLKGPAMTIDTSCSSSLTALHMACKSIQNGECSMALVGGAQLYTLPLLSGEIGVRSVSSVTKSYDDEADGTGSGEGICAILIKKTVDAISAGDNIYAIIRGSAINSDGEAAGLTSPSLNAQRDVITAAWKNANIHPETITCIEGHGTGTRMGDPIELKAASEAFALYTKEVHFCSISSVKSNLGHLGYCSGLAGVVKAVLQLKYKTIVNTVHFKRLNRNIKLEDSALYVSNRTKFWEKNKSQIRRCGISSFGISGTNCHIILEEYNVEEEVIEERPFLFILASHSKESLLQQISNIKRCLIKNDYSLRDVCYTLSTGREHRGYRIAIVADTIQDLITKLHTIEHLNNEYVYDNIYFSDTYIKSTLKKIELPSKNYYEIKELQVLGLNFVKGIDYTWRYLFSRICCRHVSLPGSLYRKSRCWLEPEKNGSNKKSIENTTNIFPTNEFRKCVSFLSKQYSLVETIIAILYQHYLGLDNIGSDINIYDMGGDSITALAILSEINRIFDINIKPEIFLAYQSIDEIKELVYEYL